MKTKANILQFAVLIMSMQERAAIRTRLIIVSKLIAFVESAPTLPKLGAVLSDCAAVASANGDWYLAAALRRAQDEVIHSLMPTPGHNVRKIFRRKRAA